jgi:hypothetical protein
VRRAATLLATLILVVTACTPTSGQAETQALVDQLEDVAADTNRQIAWFFDLMDDEFEDRSQLYQRILDLRLPTALAINLDKAQRVEPPPGSEAEAERYITFLGEVLRATEDVDLAIATEDPLALVLAAVSLEVSAGALAVALPASSCAALTPAIGRDLCNPGALDGYEADLSRELRRFVASFRPAFRVPETFGDVIRGRVLGTLQGDAALVLAQAEERFTALEPGTAHERLHSIVLGYFPAAAEAWGRFAADPAASDPLIYGFIVDSLEEVRLATNRELEAEYELILAAFPDSQAAAIAAIWFGVDPAESLVDE